jgi:peptidyl-prolyl cis-trans isomerase A (cyclophilin A)
MRSMLSMRVLVLSFALFAVGCGQDAPPAARSTSSAQIDKPGIETLGTAKFDKPNSMAEDEPDPDPVAMPDPYPEPLVVEAPAAKPESLLMNPREATEQSPPKYKINFETSKGPFVVEVERDWAPRGADRLYNLVKIGYFTDVAFFRAIDGFMVQFGINGDPKVNQAWRMAHIKDDPVRKSNTKGMLTFATSGADSRTTQLFINYGNNAGLDGQGFSPVGQVVQGMSVVDGLYKGYGEGAPSGRGPDQGRIQSQGNVYLQADFPKMDYITKAEIAN